MQYLTTSRDFVPEELGLRTDLLFQSTRTIPGSVQYSIQRYSRPKNWIADDMGLLRYHYTGSGSEANQLELRFCVIGNMYCRKHERECSQCKANASFHCEEKVESVDFMSFTFSASLLEQFIRSRMDGNTLSEDILSFRHTTSFSRSLSLCGRTRMVLESLLNHKYSDSLENIFVNAQTQMLLLYSLDCMDEKQIDVISCKFLANEADREKILKAREVLLQHIGEPLTIKELSRKVAMNECYLKKGFKEMFGTTIFDFYQSQRMEHAKYLLYEKGLSVTEVSVLLGYSSISHFSTAFKKHTGLKPCELLLR
ncbi:MAG TPA: AraC family transcriptional regulator [Flavisolibacter sp.]|jgi:AraC-like DNA-binding protein|nr:AraC family transcriptional regulator [Flavisolibacter sp.]